MAVHSRAATGVIDSQLPRYSTRMSASARCAQFSQADEDASCAGLHPAAASAACLGRPLGVVNRAIAGRTAWSARTPEATRANANNAGFRAAGVVEQYAVAHIIASRMKLRAW